MSDLYDSQKINELETFLRKRVGWQSFTPQIYQNGFPTQSVSTAQYYADDSKVHIVALVGCQSAGNVGQPVYMLLPTYLTPSTAATLTLPIGNYTLLDTGTAYYVGNAYYAGIVSGLVAIGGVAHGLTTAIGATPSFALANGDGVGIDLTYRLA